MTISRMVLEFKKALFCGVKMPSLYDEVKATQIASLLIKLSGGKIDYAKCIKLLYSIEREALNRWMRPVIYDDLYTCRYGQIVSKSLDRAEYRKRSPNCFWSQHLTTDSNKNIHIIKDSGYDKLSRAEIELIEEIWEKNKHKTPQELFNEHHMPSLFPEYTKTESRIAISYKELLRKLGKSQQDIKEFEADLKEMEYVKGLCE